MINSKKKHFIRDIYDELQDYWLLARLGRHVASLYLEAGYANSSCGITISGD